MKIVLDAQFFDRPGILVAHELLGKYLIRRHNGKEIAVMIHEIELYEGYEDPSSHAYKGNKGRAMVMFGPAGHWYVYLCYGMYEMLNISIGKEGFPAAILIRGAGRFDGPGKLTRGLMIGRELNTMPAIKSSKLWIEDRGTIVNKKMILATPRVGIGATGAWAAKPHRFIIKDLSLRDRNTDAR